jgi:insulysin
MAPVPEPVALPARPKVVLVTDQMEKPSIDTRSYRVVRLPNDLEVLLVHDGETDKASAAMDVNVGSFCDDRDMFGMAHAVEHLLFLGTKSFPGENDYNQYLSSYSGMSNAYTAVTSTNYYFELSAKPPNEDAPVSAENPSPLLGALDRFSKFFIEPLFNESSVDRELRAVDSENKKNLQDDHWRLFQLDKSTANPNHPYSNFATGNFELLKTLPEARGVNVRDKFIEFHERHYSANRMKLVILGREPLDLLERWAVDFFSDVPNKKLAQNRWERDVPYRPEHLARQTFAKPVMDMRQMSLRFPIPEQAPILDSHPSGYVSHLIGHEGPGSIMAYAKAKGWVTGVSAGGSDTCPGSPAIFDCVMYLTEKGLERWRDLVKLFFRYVAVVRAAGPQEWIFDEQRTMADVNFRFKEKSPASRFTSGTGAVMQMPVPREMLLRDRWARRFSPRDIDAVVDALTPDNMRITLVSQTYPGGWDLRETHYGTEHRIEPIPADFMDELRRAAAGNGEEEAEDAQEDAAAATAAASTLPSSIPPSSSTPPALHLPHPNSFIPTKLEVVRRDVAAPAPAPRLVRNDGRARAWWKRDDTFWVPRANVFVRLINPALRSSPDNAIKSSFFVSFVHDALEEFAYDATLAGIEYTVTPADDLILSVAGYNDKLAVLLDRVLTTLRDIAIREDRFVIIKDRLRRTYNNFQMQSSFHQLDASVNWLNTTQRFHMEERAAALDAVTPDAVAQFHHQFMAQFYCEVYAHGNIARDEVLAITSLVESTLRPRPLEPSRIPAWRSLVLPPGANYVYEKTLRDPANINHAIEYVVYTGDASHRRTVAKTLLLEQIVQEPAFDQLRTKEQLGYVVFSGCRYFDTRVGFRVLIQSERDPEYLEDRIDAFIDQHTLALANMPDDEFDSHKRAVVARRTEKPKFLDQESLRHWNQIQIGSLDFEAADRDAEVIKTLTKAEMIAFWKTYVHPASLTRTKLSVHLLALGALPADERVAALVEELGVDEPVALKIKSVLLQGRRREDREGLRGYLLRELGLVPDQAARVLAFVDEARPDGVNGGGAHIQIQTQSSAERSSTADAATQADINGPSAAKKALPNGSAVAATNGVADAQVQTDAVQPNPMVDAHTQTEVNGVKDHATADAETQTESKAAAPTADAETQTDPVPKSSDKGDKDREGGDGEQLRPPPARAVKPVYILDAWAFKASLPMSAAQLPVKDWAEFEDSVARL